MQMNINTKFKIKLSLDSIEEFTKMLEQEKKNLPQVAVNIVKRVSEVGKENNHESTELMQVGRVGDTITGGIRTTNKGETFAEFGTGIVGSNNPTANEMLAESGWKYDVNEHGEKGWIFPVEDGTYRWTKGIPANKKFYNAMKRMEKEFPNIAKEEINK